METRQQISDAVATYHPGLVQELRRVMQNLRDVARSVEHLKDALAKERDERIPIAGREFIHIQRNAEQITRQLTTANALATDFPAVDIGDQIELIDDAWHRARSFLPAESAITERRPAATVALALEEAAKHLDEAKFFAARLTVPAQVAQYVNELRPGQTVDAHEVMLEDVPEKAQRERLLRYIKTAYRSIPGFVDVDTGLIQRYEDDRAAIRLTWIRVLFVAAVIPLGALIAGVVWPSNPAGLAITQAQVQAFTGILLGVWVGAAFHILVDVAKVRTGAAPQSLSSVGDLSNFINSNEMRIHVGFVALLVVAVLGAAFQPTMGSVGGFFVGYSADSILDVLLQRFGKTVTSNVKVLEERLR